MKNRHIFFLIIIISIFNNLKGDDQYDVRKTRWGMTPQEVIKSEDYKFFTNLTANEMPSGHVVLSSAIVDIQGIDSILSYTFKDDGLISASYWFVPTNRFKFEITKELLSDDFKRIQDFLEKQFGKPDKVIGEDKCLWNKEKTVIIHLLKEQYGNTSHGIIFYDAGVWKSIGENSALLNP